MAAPASPSQGAAAAAATATGPTATVPGTAKAASPEATGKRMRDLGEYIYNLGAVISLSSFVVTDMLQLRALQIVGGSMSLYYFSTRTPIARSPIVWCLAFMSVNVFNLARLLMQEQTVSFTEEELDVYESTFLHFGIKPRQMKSLLAEACFVDFDPAKGMKLMQQGVAAGEVMLVLHGTLEYSIEKKSTGSCLSTVVSTDDNRGATYKAGLWLGEVEYLQQTQQYAASVVMKSPCRALVWSQSALRRAVEQDSEAREALHEMLGLALMSKADMIVDTALSERTRSYTQALAVAVADGVVAPVEKRALEAFRRRAGISDAMHEQALSSLGWTPEEYRHGARFRVLALEPMEKVLQRLGLA